MNDKMPFSAFVKQNLEKNGMLGSGSHESYPYGEMVLELARCMESQHHDKTTMRRVLNILLAEAEAYYGQE